MPVVDAEGGLDLSSPDSWTAAEEESFTAFYMAIKHQTMPGHDFWIANRPDVLKRYRLQALQMGSPEGRPFSKIGTLSYLHYYAIVGFEDGVLYQIVNAQKRGRTTKAAILATLAVAFLHAGPLGMRYVATSSAEYLRDFEEPAEPSGWPTGWEVDPDAFRSGIDFATPALTGGELRALEAWYERVCGEVPAHVHFLGRHRPEVLKAYRQRFEFAIRDAMPKQMLPILQLQWEVSRGCRPGIREAALMARGFGVSRALAVDAVARGMVYCGPGGVSVVEDAAGDVFAGPGWASGEAG